MTPDNLLPNGHLSHSAAAGRLLRIVAAMLRELRPGPPAQSLRLSDRIERDLGLDSLSRVELAARIEREFDVRLPDRAAIAAVTLRDLVDAIAGAGPGVAHAGSARPDVAAPPEPVEGTPDRASTIVEAFRWHLTRHPEREHITLLDGDEIVETWSYARLWNEACVIAGGLRASNVGPDDAVALMLPTSSAFFSTFLGAMLVGAIPVPLYPPLRWTEIEEHVRGRSAILANARARALVTVPEAIFIGQLARAELPDLQAVVSVDRLREGATHGDATSTSGHDTAMLQYTSGSTGDPKGVVLRHENLLANIRAMGRAAAVTSTDRFVSWLPLYHDMGLIGAWLATMYHGVPLVVMPPTSFLARPSRWLWAIHRYRGTISAGPNFAYEIIASKVRDEDLEGLDLTSWRLAFNGAEPVRAATLERFAERLARHGFDRRALMPVYGLAESAVGLTFPPLGRGPRVEHIDAQALSHDGFATLAPVATPGLDVVSSGRPLPGHEVRVVDEAGREAPARVEGRIEFRGPSATPGFQNNAQATARLFRGDWLDTGDVGYIADGELFLTSRAKDLIKRGGHNIHPYDLEAAVGEIPGIRKGCVAVFGTVDRASGTERVIVVAETKQADVSARAALRDRIMALAAIHLNGPADEVLLVPARTVLKTSSGKIRRAACRELYEKGLLEAHRRAVWLQLAALVGHALVVRVRRVARTVVEIAYGLYAWAIVVAIAAGTLVMLALVPHANLRWRLAHRAAALLIRCLAIPMRVDGLENLTRANAAVIVVNHASYIDAIALVATLPANLHFAAKREFATMPVFGFAMRRLGAHFVDRVDPAGGVEDTRELAAAVRRGETIVVFPEGTFTRAPGLGPFRLGAFVVSAETGCPVIPVALRGTRSLLREQRWLAVRQAIAVSVQAPEMPDGTDWSGAIRLRDRVRAVVLRSCGEPDLTA